MIQTIENIRYWHELLRKKTKIIMKRKYNTNDSFALIQRFNATCRIARKFPYLSAAKLLITLNDYDLPIHFIINKENIMKKSLLKSFLLIIITSLMILLPDILRNTIIEAISNAYVNALLLAFVRLFTNSIYIAIIIIIAILIIYFIIKLLLHKNINQKLLPINNHNKPIKHKKQLQHQVEPSVEVEMPIVTVDSNETENTNNSNINRKRMKGIKFKSILSENE